MVSPKVSSPATVTSKRDANTDTFVDKSVGAKVAASWIRQVDEPEAISQNQWLEQMTLVESRWVEPAFTCKEQLEMAKRAHRLAAAGDERAAFAVLEQIYQKRAYVSYYESDAMEVAESEMSRLLDVVSNSSSDDDD